MGTFETAPYINTLTGHYDLFCIHTVSDSVQCLCFTLNEDINTTEQYVICYVVMWLLSVLYDMITYIS